MAERDEATAGRTLPRTLGDFAIEALLGEGGSGVVYEARWGHRRVALKVLREDLFPDPKQGQRFLDEARLLAAVDHPGVVKVLGSGVFADGRPYLAMEKLDGESLAAICARGPLAPDVALGWFRQLAGAVGALHDRGLVHRDVKPENVIVTGGHAVLLDLGIARPAEARSSTISQEGSIRGTPDYMAPERFFGVPAGVATDVYELALVLYVMLAGRLPWDRAGDPTARLNPPAPSTFGIVLPAALESALLTALSTRPETRPASAAALVERITGERALATSAPAPRLTADLKPVAPELAPTEVQAVSVRVPDRFRRRGFWRIAIVVALLAAIGGGAALYVRHHHEPASRVDPPLPSPAPGPNPTLVDDHETPRPPLAKEGIDGLLALHPKESLLVAGVSLAALRDSALVKSLAADADNKDLEPLRALLAKCGLDVIGKTDRVVLSAGSSVLGSPPIDLSFAGGASRDRVEHCLVALFGTESMSYAEPARGVVRASTRRSRLAPTETVLDAPALHDLMGLVDPDAAAWMVMNADGNTAPLVPGMPSPKAIYLTIVVDTALHLHGGMRFASAEDAAAALKRLEAEMDTLRKDAIGAMFLKDAHLSVEKRDVVLTFDLSEAMTRITIPAFAKSFSE